MKPLISDTIGYCALVLNLYSMTAKSEIRLRSVSAVANSVYIVYGILIGAAPVIAGCTVAVILHVSRIRKLKHLRNDRNSES